jgi:hypothetical protein
MASPFQQQALRRKFIYIGLIVALLTALLLFRSYVVEPRADQLALREQNVGSVELSGSAIRLSLTGLRGLASCILWNSALERQKKNQWDELEILVNSITKLQPHFITPWMFQSWNLSYNVAVRCDLPRDKYFYISRGIQLLAEGERQNHDQPELRFAMGTYYHQKISMHDHKIPLQCLFEMSGIDPVQRDPAWLRQPDKSGRPRLEAFCLQNPRLVRRLREKLGCTTPRQLYEFLEDNKKVPSLFGDRVEGEGDELHTRYKLNREKPFPVLPPPKSAGRNYDPTVTQSLEELGEDYDAFAAARVWYAYAQEPLPPPDPEMPGASQEITDRIHQRIPQHMTTVIFRNYPPRAQSYVGERLEEEGWFDDTGWKLPGWFPGDKFSTGDPAVVGAGRAWAENAWKRAAEMWVKHGTDNHLLLPQDRLADLRERANRILAPRGLQPGAMPPPLRRQERDDPVMVDAYRAADILNAYERYRSLTNYQHLSERAQVEAEHDTVAVRKGLYEAEQLRLSARAQALPRYEEALRDWAKILEAHPTFRLNQGIAEDSFEAEWNYILLFQGTPTAPVLKQQLFAQDLLGGALVPDLGSSYLALARLARPQGAAAPVLVGPLDGVDAKGEPILPPTSAEIVLRRKGAFHGQSASPPAARTPTTTPPAGGTPAPGESAPPSRQAPK